jgi:hypothetical protein
MFGLGQPRIGRLGQQLGSNLCCQADPVVQRGGTQADVAAWKRRPSADT